MAEYVANTIQTVLTNQNILFTDTTVCGNNSIVHREGSGLVTLKGITTQARARYKITFGANIAIPDGGTVEAISIALAVNGEPVQSTTMITTPTATAAFNNVASSIYLDIPCSCCYQISVENTSTQTIDVQNANLIVERVA